MRYRAKITAVFIFTFTFLPGVSWAETLLNANIEDTYFYGNLESSRFASHANQDIRPFSYWRAGQFVGDNERVDFPGREDENASGKLLSSITTKLYVGNEENSFIEGQSGLRLKKGTNLFLFEDGYYTYGDELALYYQLKQTVNEGNKQSQISRAYAKYRVGKFSLEAGKDNVSIGPGEYGGLLLSSNAEPYPLVKLATEEPLYLLGDWDLVIMNGWLRDDNTSVPNTQILVVNVNYKPVEWLELGLTRVEHYGGDGRPGYTLDEYPLLLMGTNDNIPTSRFNNDGFFGYEVSLYLPLDLLSPGVRNAKIYFEEDGGDANIFWQDQLPGQERSVFTLRQVSEMMGMFVAMDDDIFRLEYTKVCRDFYTHNVVGDYTYQGMSLGAPGGTNSRNLFFKHLHYFDSSTSLEYKIGAYEKPKFTNPWGAVENPLQMTRYYLSIQPEKKFGRYVVQAYLRYDKTQNYNTEFNPSAWNIVAEDKDLFIAGVSLRVNF